MRVEILGEERRRRWGDEKKLEIVMSVGIDGATVTEVAHRHDVTRQQIYTWRRTEEEGSPVAVGGPGVPSGGHDRHAEHALYAQGCRGLVRHG